MVRERKIGPGDHANEPPQEATKEPSKDSGKKARKSDPSDIPFESQADLNHSRTKQSRTKQSRPGQTPRARRDPVRKRLGPAPQADR